MLRRYFITLAGVAGLALGVGAAAAQDAPAPFDA